MAVADVICSLGEGGGSAGFKSQIAMKAHASTCKTVISVAVVSTTGASKALRVFCGMM
jgi:hypothetical protein